MTEKEFVILVDETDFPTGKMEKMEAHRKGELHRAFSVFIFNRQGRADDAATVIFEIPFTWIVDQYLLQSSQGWRIYHSSSPPKDEGGNGF